MTTPDDAPHHPSPAADPDVTAEGATAEGTTATEAPSGTGPAPSAAPGGADQEAPAPGGPAATGGASGGDASAGGEGAGGEGAGGEGAAPTPGAGEAEAGDAAGNERLEAAVRAVETALIEYEIAVETFRIEVENFARLHEERLGPLHQRLEELDAQIAEAIADRTGDPADRRRAEEARGRIMPMPQVSEMFEGWLQSEGIRPDAMAMLTEGSVQPPPRVRPSEEARTLFRELIRACHPDLVTDETERDRRGAFVSRVNNAYGRGDVDQLRALAQEWAAGPAPEPTPLTRAEELAARLEWLAHRKEMLARVAAELEAGAIGSMLRLADDDPDALLAEIAQDLQAKLANREAELARRLARPRRG